MASADSSRGEDVAVDAGDACAAELRRPLGVVPRREDAGGLEILHGPGASYKGYAAGARKVPYCLSVTPHGKEKNLRFVEEVAALYRKEERLVVGCRTGVRSKLATADLVNTEFKNVRTLQGGYLAFLRSEADDQEPARK